MAYQTGIAQTLGELLDKLSDFTQTAGWTASKSGERLNLTNSSGSWVIEYNSSTKLLISKPAGTINAYATINPSTSDLSGGGYSSYDFFVTADYVHVVVQISAGKFRHFGVGTLEKEGDYVGGQYGYGTYMLPTERNYNRSNHNFGFSDGTDSYAAVVRADGLAGDTRSPWYFAPRSINDFKAVTDANKGKYLLTLGRAAMFNKMSNAHPDEILVNYSQSGYGQTLIPCPHSLIAHCIDGVFRRLGIIRDRYECTMNGVSPRQIIEIAGERWMIVPSAQYTPLVQNYVDGIDNSGPQAVAYRIIE